tara:strand:- start:149 stop:1405 length:1257 start_codon:yes stop_codon:yes gene_type:complete
MLKEDILKQLETVQHASLDLKNKDISKRNEVLLTLAQKIREHDENIIKANQSDLAKMDEHDPRYDRLLLTKERIVSIANDIDNVASMPFDSDKIFEEKTLENGLVLQRKNVPLGVISVIYESRPNVTVDVFSLCFKSGNACVLKGGKEASHTNHYLVSLIQQALTEHLMDTHLVYLLPLARDATQILLKAREYVDVCIPRGSQQLINFVREHAEIPFIETGAGIVHTYLDESGDVEMAKAIITNAKTRRVSVCNALDTFIIHQSCIKALPNIVKKLIEKQVEIFADEMAYQVLQEHYPKSLLHFAKPEHYGKEFLAYKMSIKTVDSLSEAVSHIREHSSKHSEAIISNDNASIEFFKRQVDAAVVYVNASTAFTDGAQFGLGAEIGISTQKLHARGPMALDALTSYKWVVTGAGQIRE